MADMAVAAVWVAVVIVIGGVVAVRIVANARMARAQLDDEGQYRQLAERVIESQERAATELAELRERVASVEALLRDVG